MLSLLAKVLPTYSRSKNAGKPYGTPEFCHLPFNIDSINFNTASWDTCSPEFLLSCQRRHRRSRISRRMRISSNHLRNRRLQVFMANCYHRQSWISKAQLITIVLNSPSNYTTVKLVTLNLSAIRFVMVAQFVCLIRITRTDTLST